MPHGVPCIPGAPQTQISWYNERVPDVFKFAYEPDTLCFVAISTPSTFEKAFLPFVLDNRNSSVKDPYDQCMTACFSRVKEAFAGERLEVIQDFELHPSRRPKVIMQTAGHIAGAVHYYSCRGMHFDQLPAKKVTGSRAAAGGSRRHSGGTHSARDKNETSTKKGAHRALARLEPRIPLWMREAATHDRAHTPSCVLCTRPARTPVRAIEGVLT
ncbi:hypothetical protein HPB48_014752 [Haemaphysalis longicornis]|uniref:Cyanocobalamin reductase (cyanide-eliminating) n=1 Tax=Haemaphysalis longicornis TaxID=44386 RepID=A0A9J6FLN8_HAELO|nr:hypothetical protein HPB48_014752 [Haemaphysalis longicornis]